MENPSDVFVSYEEIEDRLKCVKCHEDVEKNNNESFACKKCEITYPYTNGVYDFLLKETTHEKNLKHLKYLSPRETQDVMDIREKSDRGFLRKLPCLLISALIVFLAVMFLILRNGIFLYVSLGLAVIQCLDYLCFKIRRQAILSEYAKTPLVVETPEDWDFANKLKETFPTMDDTTECGKGSNDSFSKVVSDFRYAECAKKFNSGFPDTSEPLLLDAGSGDGYLAKFIKKKSVYICVDVIDSLLAGAKQKIPNSIAVKASADKIPLPDNFTDFIICTESLEHFPNPSLAMDEFSRILKPGGSIVLTFPNAHRIRNFNLFHILLDLPLGRLFHSVLQPVVLHPNMWLNALTHHYDFTITMVKEMTRGKALRLEKLRSIDFPSIYKGPLRRQNIFQMMERTLSKIPIISMGGRSLFVFLKKDT